MCLIVKLGDTLSLLCTLQDVRRVRGAFQGEIISKKKENFGKKCKGPSVYYVIQIWGPERPPPPPCNIVINRGAPPPL